MASLSYQHAHTPALGPHAHPTQDVVFSRVPNQSFASIPINVQLRGLSSTENPKSATDIYFPEVRRSPFNNEYHVNHLDVVSCWKGLTLTQAAEISVWERLHCKALESQIADLFRQAIVLAEDPSTMCRLADRLPNNTAHLLAVNVRKLVYDMINLHRLEHEQSRWFASEGDLAGMVYNFCRTRDCYLETSQGPVLEAMLSYTHTKSQINVVANVQWQPPNIEFIDLPIQLQPSANYCIVPHYIAPALDPNLDFISRQLTTNAEFLVESKDLPLQWDPTLNGFRAVVPTTNTSFPYPPSQGEGALGRSRSAQSRLRLLELYGLAETARSSLGTTFSAKLVIPFPGSSVRHERTTRYTVLLNVCNPQASRHVEHTTSRASTMITPTLAQLATHLPSTGVISPRDLMFSPSPRLSYVSPHKPSIYDWNDCASPRKRKTSERVPLSSMFDQTTALEGNRLALDQFEHIDLELDPDILPKRQKCGECTDHDSHIFQASADYESDSDGEDADAWYRYTLGDITTTCLGTALSIAPLAAITPSWCQTMAEENLPIRSYKSRAYKAGLDRDSKVMPSLRKKGSVKRMVFPCRKRRDSANDLPTPAYIASSSSDSDLSLNQAKIRKNYNEFLKQSADRANAPLSSGKAWSANEDAKAFEKIFTETSQTEEWSSDGEDARTESEGLSFVGDKELHYQQY